MGGHDNKTSIRISKKVRNNKFNNIKVGNIRRIFENHPFQYKMNFQQFLKLYKNGKIKL